MKKYSIAILLPVLLAGLTATALLSAADSSQKSPNFSKFVTIDVPWADSTVAAMGIGPSGDVVGMYLDGANTRGFLLQNGVFRTIDFPDANVVKTFACKINAAGTIIGTVMTAGECPHCAPWLQGIFRAYTFKKDTYTSFTIPGAFYTWAYEINPRGDMVGEFQRNETNYPVHGFILKKGGDLTQVDFPEAVWSGIQGINANGDYAGWGGDISIATFHGYVVINGKLTRIDVPGYAWTIASGINDQGEVVGTSFDADFNGHGYFWSKGVRTSIEFPGAIGTILNGINNRGDIAGEYVMVDPVTKVPKTHGFVLYR
ncbi:MAG: hypothetical protein J0H49_37085 [Acidobacteria bacterium]|nr:hypothetical protein [Acidobacteriota bacterium]